MPIAQWSRWPGWLRVLFFAWKAERATRSGFDIVHSHTSGRCGDVDVMHVTPVRYNWRVRAISRRKKWLSYLSPRVRTYLGLEARRIAPRVGHRTVAVSILISEQLSQAYPDLPELAIIPPGVAIPDPVLSRSREQTRESLGWAPSDTVCLLVARDPMRKGLPIVLNALRQLPAWVKLLVVGSDPASRDLSFVASRYGTLLERVRLVPETSNVAPYYAASDICVHPTLNDSFGMAPLEAMSFGLPVILSPYPWCGFAQYVEDDESALLLSHPEDAGQLAHFIQRLAADPALRARLKRGAMDVVNRHCWPGIAAYFESLYEDVVAEKIGIAKARDEGTA